MDFTLLSIDPPRGHKVKEDRSEGDAETYQAIQTVEQQQRKRDQFDRMMNGAF